jgi:hypothetical protein
MFGWELRCLPFKTCKVQPTSSSTPRWSRWYASVNEKEPGQPMGDRAQALGRSREGG